MLNERKINHFWTAEKNHDHTILASSILKGGTPPLPLEHIFDNLPLPPFQDLKKAVFFFIFAHPKKKG